MMVKSSKEKDEEDGIFRVDNEDLSSSKTLAGSSINRKYMYAAAGLILACALIGVLVYPQEQEQEQQQQSGSMASASSCTLQDCSLKVISVMKNGKRHLCKEFCTEQLEWKTVGENKPLDDTTKLYGNFDKHGMCKERSELGFKTQEVKEEKKKGDAPAPELIARSTDGMPDTSSLLSSIQGQTILIVGESTMRQYMEVLPMWFPDTKVETSSYVYNASAPDGYQSVANCDLNFKTGTQSCRQGAGARFDCNCTSVISMTIADHTTIQYACGYGLEFENQKTKEPQIYGKPVDFNVVKPALYKKLAETATAVIVSMGVIGHAAHDKGGYLAMLAYIQQWSKEHSKVVFSLTPPQHFHTTKPPTSYQDEERVDGNCVEEAVRHWTNKDARQLLHGSTVDLMDVFPYLWNHGRFHSNKGGDCANWCLGHDVFYAFWKVLTEAIA